MKIGVENAEIMGRKLFSQEAVSAEEMKTIKLWEYEVGPGPGRCWGKPVDRLFDLEKRVR